MTGRCGTIVDRLLALDGSRPFLVPADGTDVTMTYGALMERARAAAGRMHVWGGRPGDVVLLFMPHSPDLYVAFVGAILGGLVPSIMPCPSRKQEPALFWSAHTALLERVEPRLLLVGTENAEQFAVNLPAHAGRLRRTEDLCLGPSLAPVLPCADDIAVLQHSSGTTSLKKGVMLTHRQVLAAVAAYRHAIGFGPNDVVASWLPLYHDMGLMACLMPTLLTGTRLIALDPFKWVAAPALLLEAIERHRATFCWLPNFAFHHLARAIRPDRVFDLSSVRAFINCSEPSSPQTFDLFLQRFAACGVTEQRLQTCYAMAENVFAVTQTTLAAPVRRLQVDRSTFEAEARALPGDGPRLLSCGVPIPGVDLQIADEAGAALPDGRVGEILIASPFLFTGYIGQPALTAERLRDGWFRSGDLGFLDGGELFVTGRRDDLLISHGRNHYAHEIEHIASEVPGVVPGRCVCFAVPDRHAGTSHLVLAAETRGDIDDPTLTRALREAVLAACNVTLHHVALRPRGWLIKTTSGKISRETSRQRYLVERGELAA